MSKQIKKVLSIVIYVINCHDIPFVLLQIINWLLYFNMKIDWTIIITRLQKEKNVFEVCSFCFIKIFTFSQWRSLEASSENRGIIKSLFNSKNKIGKWWKYLKINIKNKKKRFWKHIRRFILVLYGSKLKRLVHKIKILGYIWLHWCNLVCVKHTQCRFKLKKNEKPFRNIMICGLPQVRHTQSIIIKMDYIALICFKVK